MTPDPEKVWAVIDKHAKEVRLAFVLDLLPVLGMRLTVMPKASDSRSKPIGGDRETGLRPQDESGGAERQSPKT